MLKPIQLENKRYKVLVYDKHEKCRGLEGVALQTDSLSEVNDYFRTIWNASENERDVMGESIFPQDIGDDEINYFQFYDTLKQEYVDGEFEDVWDFVKKVLNEEQSEIVNKVTLKELDVIEGVPFNYTLISTFNNEIEGLANPVRKTVVAHSNERIELVDELNKMIRHGCDNYTLYLNKTGERYFGSANDIIKQLKYGYVIEGKQSASTEAILQDIREMLNHPSIFEKTPANLMTWNTYLTRTIGTLSNSMLQLEGVTISESGYTANEEDVYSNVISLAYDAVRCAKFMNSTGIGKHSNAEYEPKPASQRFDSQSDDPMVALKLEVLDYVSTPHNEWTTEKKSKIIELNKRMKEMINSLPDK